MLHSFRLPAIHFSSRLTRTTSNFHRQHHRRSGTTGAAILLSISSITALGAASSSSSSNSNRDKNPTPINSRVHNNTWSDSLSEVTVNNGSQYNPLTYTNTTSCEEESTPISKIPEYLLKYDHYNGVILHLDWIFNHPNSTTSNSMMYKENNNNNSTRVKQEDLEALVHEWIQHPEQFDQLLQSSLQQWKEEGRKGVWVHLPKSMAPLVPICVKHGFDFHSCQDHNRINSGTVTGSTTLILSQWLPTDIVSRLPLGPYFQAGVGCVVLHPHDPSKMLVVKELTGPAAVRNLWKMPTGLIDPGEDVAEAALRELEEETGLFGASCEGILAMRQAHGASAGRAASDLFFVVLLRAPSAKSIDNLQAQEHEIADIQWMSVEEYANQEVWLKSPVYLELNQAILDASRNQREGKPSPVVVPHKLNVGWTGGTNTVYRSNL